MTNRELKSITWCVRTQA